MIVDCALYVDGRRESVSLAQAVSQARNRPGSFVWLGLHDPTHDEFDDLALYFAPHPLAIEDAINAHQRPKLDIYDECLFVVLKTLSHDEERAEIQTGEIMLFTGENFMVTVQHGRDDVLAPVRKRLEGMPELLRLGPSAVLYGVCDAVVDTYEELAVDVEQHLEDLERKVFASDGGADGARIYALKRQVLEFRHAVMPLAQPMRVLTGARLDGIHPAIPSPTSATSATTSPASRTGSRRSTRCSPTSSPPTWPRSASSRTRRPGSRTRTRAGSRRGWRSSRPTVLTGIYGMNFDNMPELHTHYGYFVLLLVMLVLNVGLYLQFRRSGWL